MDIIIKGSNVMTNEDLNFIRTRMKRLEEVYKQSNDPAVRRAVRDKTLYEIGGRFPEFFETYADAFEACQMSSLMEIDSLYKSVMSQYSAEKLSPIARTDEKKVQKMLKLKDKAFKQFLKGYNEAAGDMPLTYYSQRIDDKFIFLTQEDGQFVGATTNVSQNQRNGECLCHFCRQFRRGPEIIFVTNSVRTAKDEYSSIGQTICSDHERCNKNIEDRSRVLKFIKYKKEDQER